MFRKACLLLILAGLGTACQPNKNAQPQPARQPTWNGKMQKFSSCAEIQTYVQSFYGNFSEADPIASATPQAYQNQVDGIAEGDLLQIHPLYYFFARPGFIEVVNRTTLQNHQSIPVRAMSQHWLIHSDNKLISIGGDSKQTWVQVFDETNQFSLISEKTLSGSPLDFRLSQGKLVIVSRTSIYDSPSSTSCSDIYQPNLEDGSGQITFVNVVSLTDLTREAQTLGFLGDTNFLYMTSNELFLFRATPWADSYFRLIDWTTPTLTFKQVSRIEGAPKDRWAVHKKGEDLFIATSSTPNWNRPQAVRTNRMLVLQKDLLGLYNETSRSPSFGDNEDIRSILYKDDKAYVVTFEKTDPLFILDIQDSKNIQIIAELKSPGFSTQLTELAGTQLGGLGVQVDPAQGFSWFGGIKFSLFDLQNPLAPLETSVLHWGDRGSYSEATTESKALFISADKMRVLFPAVIVKNESTSQPWLSATELDFAGAIQLEAENGQLIEKQRFTHKEWREPACGEKAYFPSYSWDYHTSSMDIQRIIEIDGCIDTFSRFGVMRSCPLAAERKLQFSSSADLCKPSWNLSGSI